MARSANVYLNNHRVGVLLEEQEGFVFQYDPKYVGQEDSKAISLTLPLQTEPFKAPTLFPFFCGLMAEGVNKEMQCRLLKIDENDLFGILLQTADKDTIGAVTVRPKQTKG